MEKITNEELQEKVELFVEKHNNKDFNIFFYCNDTKGNALGSIAQIYEHVKLLTKAGYKAHVLYDNDKFTTVAGWLGIEYAELSHKFLVVDGKPADLQISANDYLIIPEVYANIMQQSVKLPCKKIVLVQNYTYISEILPLDKTWGMYKFDDAIVTSEVLGNFVKQIMPSVKIHETPVLFNETLFTSYNKPQKPIITFVTKEQTDFRLIISEFFRKYPIFRWFTPRELRGFSQEEYATALKESAVMVWVDKRSTFGTAPIEAMMCGVPVIGVVPTLIPDWMVTKTEDGGISLKNNGMWLGSTLEVADVLSNFCQAYLEDNIPQTYYDEMKETVSGFDYQADSDKVVELYQTIFDNRKTEIQTMLTNKLNKTEE